MTRPFLRRFALMGTTLAMLMALGSADRAVAQDKKIKLAFSDKADGSNLKSELILRPNIVQPVYVYVRNMGEQAEEVTLELRAGGDTVDGGTIKVAAPAGKATRVVFPKPAPPPPGTKPVAPALTPLSGPFDIRLLSGNTALDEVKVNVARPNEYVEVTAIEFDPREQNNRKNRLTVRLKAKETFTGPRARVELVLRPDRIPGLVASQRKEGSYAGYLAAPGGELVLSADNLKFQGGDDRRNGLVYLTIDGYERAFTYNTTFPQGNTPSTPARIIQPVLGIDVPKFAAPTATFKIGVEVDNAPSGAIAELGIDRDSDGKFEEANGEIVKFVGDRQERILLSVFGPSGSIVLKPEVSDWSADLDLTEVFGPRSLRLRLLDKGQVIPARDSAEDKLVPEVLRTVTLDGTRPEGVKFVGFPKQLDRGSLLPVKATSAVPESGIANVVFFTGKLAADGKIPESAIVVNGKLIDAKANLWAADLPLPTDQKSTHEVSVRFTNGAGLTAIETVRIQLIDPDAGKVPGTVPASKLSSIEGSVVEGGRGQPNLEVQLKDTDGKAVKATTTTDATGKFVFKDVQPGAYKVTAAKSAAKTKGETAVTVGETQKKTGVEVKLTR